MEFIAAFDPDSSFQKKIQEVLEATGDLRVPFSLMADQWFQGNKSIFALKGPGRYKDLSTRPVNAFWEVNKTYREAYKEGGYKAYKIKRYGSAYPILFATGRLSRSLTENNIDSIRIVEKDQLTLGTKVSYGVYHQSQGVRTKMPYRPFLFVGVEQIAPNDIRQRRVSGWLATLDSYLEQKGK